MAPLWLEKSLLSLSLAYTSSPSACPLLPCVVRRNKKSAAAVSSSPQATEAPTTAPTLKLGPSSSSGLASSSDSGVEEGVGVATSASAPSIIWTSSAEATSELSPLAACARLVTWSVVMLLALLDNASNSLWSAATILADTLAASRCLRRVSVTTVLIWYAWILKKVLSSAANDRPNTLPLTLPLTTNDRTTVAPSATVNVVSCTGPTAPSSAQA
mmetsp:Transcript_92762/g.139175  ORF Transcript_92762/g.139175 Transcript_92762/m.139175 type:complete len:215 (-) Transcript_92762:2164-2808(-)